MGAQASSQQLKNPPAVRSRVSPSHTQQQLRLSVTIVGGKDCTSPTTTFCCIEVSTVVSARQQNGKDALMHISLVHMDWTQMSSNNHFMWTRCLTLAVDVQSEITSAFCCILIACLSNYWAFFLPLVPTGLISSTEKEKSYKQSHPKAAHRIEILHTEGVLDRKKKGLRRSRTLCM